MSIFITPQTFADSFKSKRAEAIKNYKNGEVKLAFKKLEALVKKGDSEAARDIGLLFLRGKFVDVDKAFNWLEISAMMCNSRALDLLKREYFKRGGPHFKPTRIEYIQSKCDDYKNKNRKLAEKPKKKKKLFKKKYSKKNDNQSDTKFISKSVKNSWKKVQPIKNNLKYSGWGSAFAISKNGHFLTNHHVIKNCIEVDIYYNKMFGSAKVLAVNKKMDSAILKVNALTPFYLSFDSNDHKLGEDLYAAGYPITTDLIFRKAVKNMTLSKGILANTEIIRSNFLLISVPIASGNSGGPVLGKYGLIRGQITAGYDIKKLVTNFDKYVKRKTGANSSQTLETNITMNLMISSIKLKNWINSTNIIYKNDGKRRKKLDSDEIGEIATRTVSAVSCYR